MKRSFAMLMMVAVVVVSSGCSVSGPMRNSLARGVGDVGSTAFLDATKGVPQPQLIALADRAIDWLDVLSQNETLMASPTASDVLRTSLFNMIPEQFSWIIDQLKDRLTGVFSEDTEIARHFFIGIRNGADYWFCD